MLNIFISHAWTENAAYERFVALLNEEPGMGNWTDVSIPESRRLELSLGHLSAEERRVEMLKIALAKAEALLADPNLPDVGQRIVYKGGEGVEVPTRGSVSLDRDRIYRDLEQLAYSAAVGSGEAEQWDPKASYTSMQRYPELALPIQERVRTADVVFVLITPFLNYRDWVNFEVAVCARLKVPVVGVQMGESVSPNYRVECKEVIACDRGQVRKALDAARARWLARG